MVWGCSPGEKKWRSQNGRNITFLIYFSHFNRFRKVLEEQSPRHKNRALLSRFSLTNVSAGAATTVSRCWVAHLGKVCQSAMIYEETEPCLTVCEWAPAMNYRHGCAVDWKCGTASFARMLRGCSREPPVTLWDLCTTAFVSAARKLAPGMSDHGKLTHVLFSRQFLRVWRKNLKNVFCQP